MLVDPVGKESNGKSNQEHEMRVSECGDAERGACHAILKPES